MYVLNYLAESDFKFWKDKIFCDNSFIFVFGIWLFF